MHRRSTQNLDTISLPYGLRFSRGIRRHPHRRSKSPTTCYIQPLPVAVRIYRSCDLSDKALHLAFLTNLLLIGLRPRNRGLVSITDQRLMLNCVIYFH